MFVLEMHLLYINILVAVKDAFFPSLLGYFESHFGMRVCRMSFLSLIFCYFHCYQWQAGGAAA